LSKWLITILFLFISTILSHWLPFSPFFRNINTLIHEFGHALVTLLLSGNVLYIYLFSDHSGVTMSAIENGWRLIPVALSGYVTASLFAVYLFRAYCRGRQKQGLAMITLIAAVSLIFFVRNEFGVLWLLGFIALNGLFLVLFGPMLRNVYYLLIAFLTLEESVFGPVTLLIASLNDPAQAGDATTLSSATAFPAWLWSGAFTLFALYCAKHALQAFVDNRGRRRSGRIQPAHYSD